MKRRPRKNIDFLLADVRHPGATSARKEKRVKKASLSKRLKVFGLTALLVALLGALLLLDIGGSATSLYKQFRRLADAVRGFDTNLDYIGALDGIEGELGGLDRKARLLAAIPKLKQIPEAIGALKDIVGTAKALGGNLNDLSSKGFSLVFSGGGDELIGLLSDMQSNLGRIRSVSARLQDIVAEFGVEKSNIDFITNDLIKAEDGLGAMVSFLDSPEPRRIVLWFLNPSELRPNGGFAGSYGELVLDRGSVESLEVNDIYYPDKFLPLKVVPPTQLQSVTPNWGARDTGWFFDFSESSENLIEYLEASSIYEEDVHFDGVIALNTRVIEDLLRLTGPIDVPEYDMQLDHENFLRELQQEVEANKVPGQNPKRVLQFAAPRLIEALGSLEGANRNQLIEVFVTRARNKDIQMYFEHEGMSKLTRDMGVDGRPYRVDQDFVGDYLALVNTNIAGGKTDIFVDQQAALRSVIGPDGQVTNELTVTRYHTGGAQPESWYNHLNQNFFKVFTHPSSTLTYMEGGFQKSIRQLINYAVSGYREDPDLAELESTRTMLPVPPDGYAEQYQEGDKRVFATWFNLEPGDRKTLKMRWRADRVPITNGQRFTFVLDKQSGSEMDFDYAIVAPEGYYWSDSGSNIFRYRENSLPGRVVLELQLKKD